MGLHYTRIENAHTHTINLCNFHIFLASIRYSCTAEVYLKLLEMFTNICIFPIILNKLFNIFITGRMMITRNIKITEKKWKKTYQRQT